jgi:integrator complex subunit 8
LLLAACEWEFLLGLDVRWNLNLNVELASSLAAVCYDLQRDRERPTRKNSKSLWELIIPAFNPASSNSGTIASQGGGSSLKRTAAGALQQGASSSRDSPNANVPMVNRAALSNFCQLIYEPQSLSIILSLFVRLHNVVQDEANLEITADLSSLWPAVLSNANSYYLPGIGEILSQLLERALSLYPLNTAWLKLQGDLHFAQGFHSAAMSCYMTASSLASDYFHQVVPKQVLDEATIRRMIKCSHSASCFTQVLMGSCVIFNDKILIFSLFFQSALLCQLLEEIDYATAFRCLQERGCNDAMDSLYPFIWDVTLLEFIIQLHHKRGETQRKTVAVSSM